MEHATQRPRRAAVGRGKDRPKEVYSTPVWSWVRGRGKDRPKEVYFTPVWSWVRYREGCAMDHSYVLCGNGVGHQLGAKIELGTQGLIFSHFSLCCELFCIEKHDKCEQTAWIFRNDFY